MCIHDRSTFSHKTALYSDQSWLIKSCQKLRAIVCVCTPTKALGYEYESSPRKRGKKKTT